MPSLTKFNLGVTHRLARRRNYGVPVLNIFVMNARNTQRDTRVLIFRCIELMLSVLFLVHVAFVSEDYNVVPLILLCAYLGDIPFLMLLGSYIFTYVVYPLSCSHDIVRMFQLCDYPSYIVVYLGFIANMIVITKLT